MGEATSMGAMLMCSFGTGPSELVVLPTTRITVDGMPVANISAMVPMLNIPPFPMCISPIAGGIPIPCIPTLVGPWMPMGTIMFGGMPALDSLSKAICAREGIVMITFPGQVKITMA